MKQFRFFTVMEYEEEQEYLRKRHQEGWKFTKVSWPGIYDFEKCEPEDVVYQLDYNKEGLEHREEYGQMFQDCGWEYICDFVGYSYFRKPVSEMREQETIFNDDESRMDMLKRVFQGRMVPMFVIFIAVIIPQLVIQMTAQTPYRSVLFAIYVVLLLVYTGVFIKAARKYFALRQQK